MKSEFLDVRRVFFNSEARRLVYVQLPLEDDSLGMCGKLHTSMYGTSDAPQNWEFAMRTILVEMCCTRGRASPRVYYHAKKQIRLVMHGDDITTLGYDEDLERFRAELHKSLDIKTCGRFGPGKDDQNSIRILNRVVT